MYITSELLPATCVALALACTQPASAGIMTVVDVGVVGSSAAQGPPGLFSSIDYGGLFALPGTNLSGAPYKAVFTFDLSQAKLGNPYSIPNFASAYGGGYMGGSLAFGSVVVTINGVSVAATGSDFADMQAQSGQMSLGGSWFNTYHQQVVYTNNSITNQTFHSDTQSSLATIGTSPSLDYLLTGVFASPNYMIGSMYSYQTEIYNDDVSVVSPFSLFNANLSSITVSYASTPEAATWAMMLGGSPLSPPSASAGGEPSCSAERDPDDPMQHD